MISGGHLTEFKQIEFKQIGQSASTMQDCFAGLNKEFCHTFFPWVIITAKIFTIELQVSFRDL